MTGQAEIARKRQQLEATFARARSLEVGSEIQSDMARHICVLVSGYLEGAVSELLLEYVRNHSDRRTQSFAQNGLDRLTNLKAQRLLQVIGGFDKEWHRKLELFLVDEHKTAVDSVVDLRNAIAHGRHVGITIVRISDYFQSINTLLDKLAEICLKR